LFCYLGDRQLTACTGCIVRLEDPFIVEHQLSVERKDNCF